jgi:hypothetical protein
LRLSGVAYVVRSAYGDTGVREAGLLGGARERGCGQIVRRHLNLSVAKKKKPPVMTECEVKVRGRWLPCTIYEALTERAEVMRCKYFLGPVQALKESSNGARAHIEHLQRHPGCRFPVSTFSGVESKHPLALK